MAAARRRWIGFGVGVVAGAVIAAGIAMRGGPPPAADGPGEQPTPVERPDAASAPPAASVPSSATPAAQAAQLVAAAQAETTAGHHAQAHEMLGRAYALDPQPPTLLELAAVDLRLGRCRDARRAAQRVLAASPGGGLAEQASRLLAQIGRCD